VIVDVVLLWEVDHAELTSFIDEESKAHVSTVHVLSCAANYPPERFEVGRICRIFRKVVLLEPKHAGPCDACALLFDAL
jgi:hypothetical protein